MLELRRRPLALLWCLSLAARAAFAQPGAAASITVKPSKPLAVYAVGDVIHWDITLAGEGADQVKELDYAVRRNGAVTLSQGKLPLTDGRASLETKLDQPGAVLADLRATVAGKLVRNWAGAVAEPEKIQPSEPAPADFDEFWKAKLDELAKVPVDPQLTPVDGGRAGVDYWKITLGNIRGTHVQGQLARPKTGDKFPAVLVVQWAGVYGLDKSWVTGHAANGWLALNICAHDIAIDQPKDYYDKLNNGELKDYVGIGNEDRETSYFLRMYLSCSRAVDYLTSRPDWDGKTIVVTGGSQGGLQTLMLAGLRPDKITGALAMVPAGCDTTSSLHERMQGWPYWQGHTGGKDAAKVMATSKYYDVVNFARHIKCPVLVGLGLIDQTCPPCNVYSAFNQIQTPKEAVIMPFSEHQAKGNSQASYYPRFNAWLAALAKGNTPAKP